MPAFAFFFLFVCILLLKRPGCLWKSWAILPAMSPLSILQTFPPSFWLCLLQFSSFLTEMSPGPRVLMSLIRLQLGSHPCNICRLGAGGLALPLPTAPRLLAIRQVPARLTACWDTTGLPGGGNQKKGLHWESRHGVFFAVQSMSMLASSPQQLAVLQPQRGSQEHFCCWTPDHGHPFGACCGADVSYSFTLKYNSWKAAFAPGQHQEHLKTLVMFAGLCLPLIFHTSALYPKGLLFI